MMHHVARKRALAALLTVTGVCVLWREAVPSLGDDPCFCSRCSPNDEPRFGRRFNKSVQPFLSANYNLSEDAFGWWKRLQGEKRNFSSYREAVDRLFQTLPSSPDVSRSGPHRCRTCAVVGNSGNLQKSRYGPLIDFHDVIIRMNTARIEGFEKDVGIRTTHRIMYPESAVDLDSATHLVLVPFKILDLEWVTKALSTGFSGRSYLPVKSKVKANKDLVMVVNPAFMRYVHDTWLGRKGRYPSTGFMALVLALHMCDEVHVFGYGADRHGNWNHYWERLKDQKLRTGVHPGSLEYAIIQELAAQQKLTVYSGW